MNPAVPPQADLRSDGLTPLETPPFLFTLTAGPGAEPWRESARGEEPFAFTRWVNVIHRQVPEVSVISCDHAVQMPG